MTDLQRIIDVIEQEPKTVQEIVSRTGYSESGVKASIEFMVVRPKEYHIKTFVSRDGKTYAYQSFPVAEKVV